MSQVSYGTIAITDLTDIKDMYLQYCMAVDSITTAAAIEAKTTWTNPEVNWFTLTADTTVNSNKRYYRLNSGDYYVITPIGSENPSSNGWYEDTAYPSWQSGYQIWIREVRIKEGIELPEYGTPYLDKAINQINTRIKKIWSNSTGSYMASGVEVDGVTREVDISDSSTYGFNSKTTTTGISFNYNDWKAIELDGNIPALKFYEPSKTSQGIQTVQIDSNGMKLLKGGIEAGELNENNFIYVSSEPYGENYSINNTKSNDWKQIVGTRFGIRSDGTLYATGAHIEDSIEAESLRIGQWTTFDHRLKLCEGHYNQSNDTEVQRGKTYFKQNNTNPNVYDIVIPNGGENPNEQRWYELDQTPPDGWENWSVSHKEYAEKYFVATEYEDDYENINTGFTEFGSKYYATTDEEAANDKIYYQRTGSIGSYKYTAIDNPSGSPSQQGWFELQKFFYEKDVDSPQMIIGNKENFAVTVDNTQITFWYDHQKVAFINGDQMQIPRSVMLEEMLIGQKKWSWREHEGNLQLKWIGD